MDESWNAWGGPDRRPALPAGAAELLGLRPGDARRPADLAEVGLAAPRAPGPALAALRAAVGAEHVRTDRESRIRHTRGKSTLDLLRIRSGEAADAPDAVVLPGSHDEVLAVLAACSADRIAVVPFGGGTSVVGGLAPDVAGFAGTVALDLRRLDRLRAVDPVSRTATFEPGLRAPRAEELLRERGFTLGHFPQSYERATIGGFAAARSSGQASAGYGRFDEMVVALTAAAPAGPLDLGRAPRSAAGPDLRQLLLGSEGALGVITSVTAAVRPAPETSSYEGWRFDDFAAGAAALRRLAQDGPRPTVLRLSDETETLAGGSGEGGCVAIAGFEGTVGEVATRRDAAGEVLRAAGGTPLGPGPGESWERGRFAAPYLRDALLEAGAFAETLETATFWSGLPGLYEAVRAALIPAYPLVMCHISHVYPAGGSLYFTVAGPLGDEPAGAWRAAKDAAGAAIEAAGGTISHHHGVGTDHRGWYSREVGPLAVDLLRAVKRRLDPAGILNPGVLVPPDIPPDP